MSDVTPQTAIEQINRNLDEYQKSAKAAAEHIERFGQQSGELTEKVKEMETDMAAAIGQIQEIKRAGALGQQHQAINPAEAEQKSGFEAFLRKNEGRFTEAERKALSSLTNPDGGYLMPRATQGMMIQQIKDFSPVRRYASVISISGDSFEGLYDDDDVGGGWVGESQARPETSTPQLARYRIETNELYAFPQITQKLLEDAEVDVQAWLIRKISTTFGRFESNAFINGDGANKPKGLLAQTLTTSATLQRGQVQKIKTGVNGGFAAKPDGWLKFADAVAALRADYANRVWAMNRFTLAEVMKLQDSDGRAIWQPNFAEGQMGTLMGFAVDAGFDHMPNISNGSKSIIFGDIGRAYQIIDRKTVSIIRDDLTNKPFVGYYATRRTGGNVIDNEAYKVMTFEA